MRTGSFRAPYVSLVLAAIAGGAIASGGGLMGLATASAAGGTMEEIVRPLFVKRCGDCHGPDTQEGNLRLDIRHRALKGGDFGPVIVPGKAAESELIRRITSTDKKR